MVGYCVAFEFVQIEESHNDFFFMPERKAAERRRKPKAVSPQNAEFMVFPLLSPPLIVTRIPLSVN